jgi:hypothetical protein
MVPGCVAKKDAAVKTEGKITLKKTRPLHIRPFGNGFLMYVGEN